ncbi:hypothetical protein JN00_0148 [Metamycoplasma subdolum]|uniref:DUF4044 domain-containing protein n=1 Tax=Metamycoplasma subdolum TaxID=92407 RepID=A0A3M0A378_9BACT|nr:hypothetical protein [Metamycoplasma subdolum]RMA79097.1 hypothetical protein JN00_0148 [Metamycoplasma subdolum]WPB50620.1 hypothetical protein R9C05_00460 [Metamycoplasma subdolum]
MEKIDNYEYSLIKKQQGKQRVKKSISWVLIFIVIVAGLAIVALATFGLINFIIQAVNKGV